MEYRRVAIDTSKHVFTLHGVDAQDHPVLRRSSLNSPSRNSPAFTAERACTNSGRIRFFTSRSDDAHNSSVVSTGVNPDHDF